jgi:transposase-like protein
MSIVLLQLPEVKYCQTARPNRCPYCPGETFQRWGGNTREVQDPHLREVLVYRYRCCECHRVFRHYPEGVSRAKQTMRMMKMAAICWALGMSHRGVVVLLAMFGIQLGHMTIWRDVQEQAERVRCSKQWSKVRVLGVDGLYVRGWGDTQPVLVAVDMGTGQPVALGYLDEKDPLAVQKFLEPLVQRLGVSVIVTDDLFSYKVAASKLNLEQQVCQFHLRRWVGKVLHDLRTSLSVDWLPTLDEVKLLVQELPAEGDKRLVQIYRQIPANRAGRRAEPMTPIEQLRHLVARLAEDWAKYRVFDWQPQVPWTNNLTEQANGRMKMRARTVRGYKTETGMLNGLLWSATAIS